MATNELDLEPSESRLVMVQMHAICVWAIGKLDHYLWELGRELNPSDSVARLHFAHEWHSFVRECQRGFQLVSRLVRVVPSSIACWDSFGDLCGSLGNGGIKDDVTPVFFTDSISDRDFVTVLTRYQVAGNEEFVPIFKESARDVLNSFEHLRCEIESVRPELKNEHQIVLRNHN